MSRSEPLAIVFADISGSTRLFEQKGDVAARQLVAKVLGALAEVTRRHGGRVVKTIGDEIMSVFPTAIQGVHAAMEMQRLTTREPDFVRENLGLRIGMHYGEALVEDNDVFGDAVNTAARMTAIAKREQIVTTAGSLRDVTGSTQLRTRSLGRTRVAGKLFPVEICDVLWQEDLAGVTMVQRAVRLDDGESIGARLSIRHRGRLIELNEDSPPFRMGRDPGNELVVDAEWVSRYHALIEYKRGISCSRIAARMAPTFAWGTMRNSASTATKCTCESRGRSAWGSRSRSTPRMPSISNATTAVAVERRRRGRGGPRLRASGRLIAVEASEKPLPAAILGC